jgi:hypothetical protein
LAVLFSNIDDLSSLVFFCKLLLLFLLFYALTPFTLAPADLAGAGF